MSHHQTGNINCDQQCEIPPGVTLAETPPSRHAWSDVVRCPNDGCGKTFLVVSRDQTGDDQTD